MGRFDLPVRLIDELVARGDAPGMALVVCSSTGVLLEHATGWADRAAGIEVGPETRFALASLTKPLIAAAVLVGVEEGLLDLDDPLADLVPGLAPGITARACLAHAAGLPERFDPAALGLPDRPAWAAVRDAVGRSVALEDPWTRRRYSNVAYVAVAAGLEQASGLRIDEYLRAAILEPLGMDGTSLGLAPQHAAAHVRDAGLFARGIQFFNDPWFRAEPQPGGGAFGTASDYVSFLQMVLRRGDHDGAALLAAETTDEMLDNQGGALAGGVESFMTFPRCDWALGFEVHGSRDGHYTGNAPSPSAGVHFGSSGTVCVIDRAHDLALVLLANRGTYSGWMLRPGGWPDIVRAVYDACL